MTLVLVLLTGWLVIPGLCTADRILAKTWVTPFTVLSAPLLLLLTFAAVFAAPLGFTEVDAGAAAVLLLGLIIFWAASGAVLCAFGRRVPAPAREPALGEREARMLIIAVSWTFVAIMGVAFYRALSDFGSILDIGTDDFQHRFEIGMSGTVRPMAMLFFVFVAGSADRGAWLERLTALALFACLAASLVKGTMLLPVVGATIYRLLTGRARLSWEAVGAVAGASVVIFFGIYLIEPLVLGLASSDVYLEIARHALSYLFSGVLGFSGAWSSGMTTSQGDWALIVAPLWNVLAYLTGQPRALHLSERVMVIDTRAGRFGVESNVRTLYGTLIEFWGLPGGSVAMFILGLLIVLMYVAARRSGNRWMLATVSLLMSALFFGWFDYYFALTFWYIAVAVGLMLTVFWQGLSRGLPRLSTPGNPPL